MSTTPIDNTKVTSTPQSSAHEIDNALKALNLRRNNRLKEHADKLAASTETASFVNPIPSRHHLSETALEMAHPSPHIDDTIHAPEGMIFPSTEALVRVANRIDSGQYPNHNDPFLDQLHAYLLQPENTEIIHHRLKDKPNGPEMMKIRGWLCTSDRVRQTQNQLIRAAVIDEERMRNTEDTQFRSLLAMGIKEAIWSTIPNPSAYPQNPSFPESPKIPVEVLVTTTTHTEEISGSTPIDLNPNNDTYLDANTGMFPPDSPTTIARKERITEVQARQSARYPPQTDNEPVDPATLTRSEEEEPPLPIPPPRQNHADPRVSERREAAVQRSRRRGRQPEILYLGGLSYVDAYHQIPVHINRGGVPRGAYLISSDPPPPFQNSHTYAPDPTSRRSRSTTCYHCHRPGHRQIHCEEYRCPHCRQTAPGHHSPQCNAGPNRNRDRRSGSSDDNDNVDNNDVDDYVNLDGER